MWEQWVKVNFQEQKIGDYLVSYVTGHLAAWFCTVLDLLLKVLLLG